MYLANFVQILVQVLVIAIFLRAIISWFRLAPDNPIQVILVQVTEPILSPLRRVVPSLGMFDITPWIAMILLQVIGSLIVRNLA
ncbi:MAG TPA: YggT family protein [Chloroflexota bacterium]|jgi:YggT family protein|nr:YggT family protein [Chloroflexota bacterium]